MSTKDCRRAKLPFFDLGAAAFERTFPRAVARSIGPCTPPVYVCPICAKAFPREAVHAGMLTFEDVTPKKFGGRPLVLTCKRCNNTAGRLLDAHAHRKEAVLDVFRGRPNERRCVRVSLDGVTLKADVGVKNGAALLKVKPGDAAPQTPARRGVQCDRP